MAYPSIIKGEGPIQETIRKIAHEGFDYDIDKCSLVGPVDLAKRYAEEVRAEFDNFGLMVDLSHLPIIHESARESLIPVKDYIIHAHMGNCFMKDKQNPAYGDEDSDIVIANAKRVLNLAWAMLEDN